MAGNRGDQGKLKSPSEGRSEGCPDIAEISCDVEARETVVGGVAHVDGNWEPQDRKRKMLNAIRVGSN